MELNVVLVNKNAKKKLGQNPVILTLGLVNNTYVIIRSPVIARVFIGQRSDFFTDANFPCYTAV